MASCSSLFQVLFLNGKYSRGNPHCKRFYKNKKEETVQERSEAKHKATREAEAAAIIIAMYTLKQFLKLGLLLMTYDANEPCGSWCMVNH